MRYVNMVRGAFRPVHDSFPANISDSKYPQTREIQLLLKSPGDRTVTHKVSSLGRQGFFFSKDLHGISFPSRISL